MKRIIGIILIVVGLLAGVYAITRHDEERTILDIGDVEIKKDNKEPGNKTTIYYVIALVGVIGGGIMVSGKSQP